MQTALVITGITGRMGSSVARLALEDNFSIAAVMDRKEQLAAAAKWNVPCGFDPDEVLAGAGQAVIVDFTLPAATMPTLEAALRHSMPMVIGTTGFTPEQKARICEIAEHIPVFMSPNMSVGVNALLEILPHLARALGESYDIEITEIHHKHKKDAPSGTALRLGECLAEARGHKLDELMRCARQGITGERPAGEIGIQAVRGGDVAGVHTVYFIGEGERIEVVHHAHSRENFARGALRAARWLAGQKAGKLFTMQDMLHE